MSEAAARAGARVVASSAPGKLILAGEHAAVYGRPALVAAVDARLSVMAGETDDRGIELQLADLGVVATASAGALREYALDARARWQAFTADPTPERFRALRGEDPAHLAKVAVGETLLAHGENDRGSAEPRWSMRVESALPLGGGMGSSAAAGAALIAATLHLLGKPVDVATVEPLLLEAERRQHGSPSGVDGAVVLRGGVQWVERTETGLRFEALPAGLPLLADLRVLDSGTPGQPTGEVVTAVRQLRVSDPDAFERLLDALERATREMCTALVESDGARLADSIHHAQRGLERAGVVPGGVRELVRRIESRGGAAKISGAGALAGPGAGCLVIYHPHPASLLEGLLAPHSLLPVRLGAEGLRVEQP